MGQRRKNWANILFKDYPHLYLPFLERRLKTSKQQAEGITKLLKIHNIGNGAKILDFSCGIGHLSLELAKRNFEIIGYDPSEYYIGFGEGLLKRDRQNRKLRIRLVSGDPLKVSKILCNTTFDVVLIMGNSLGFVSQNYDMLIFKKIAKVSKTGTILVLEIEDRDWTLSHFQNNIQYQFAEIVVDEVWKFNYESSVSESRSKFYGKNRGKENHLLKLLDIHTSLRLYSIHEIIGMLRKTGWEYIKSYDSIDNLQPLTHITQDIIVVARKL